MRLSKYNRHWIVNLPYVFFGGIILHGVASLFATNYYGEYFVLEESKVPIAEVRKVDSAYSVDYTFEAFGHPWKHGIPIDPPTAERLRGMDSLSVIFNKQVPLFNYPVFFEYWDSHLRGNNAFAIFFLVFLAMDILWHSKYWQALIRRN
jgi:hypothetical protein